MQHHTDGDLERAKYTYKNTSKKYRKQSDALHLLGTVAYQEQKNHIALDLIQKCLAIHPHFAQAHNYLGLTLHALTKLEYAVDSYQKALAIKPDYADVYGNVALALNSSGNMPEALYEFNKGLKLVRGEKPVDPQHHSFRLISKAKIKHDIEQLKYLASLGYETEKFKELARVYNDVSSEINWPSIDSLAIPVSDANRNRLGETYNRPFHVVEAPEVPGTALNNDLDVGKITEKYFNHKHGMTFFNDLLNPFALQSLRRFLLCSTIWFDIKYRGSYLGAMLKGGLACPLLLQIANDLRTKFPDTFKHHQLTQLWAYRYDSLLTGINVHADFAAINVNFWVTPSTANLNSMSGGLLVYNTEDSLGWSFDAYNNDKEKSREYLDDNNAEKSVISYNENRIVLFNSNLFHKTDEFKFKEKYQNSLINVTMLFGNREV